MASPDVRGVLDFLRQNGFERAASALREDVLAMGAASGMDSSVCSAPAPCVEEAHIPLRLPPVRVGVPPDVDGYAVGGGRSGAQSSTSSSSSTDAFLSMGSSPSGLANPYAPWPVYPAESEDSSDRLSQFGTARDYDGPNIFSDTFWEDPYLLMGSSAGFTDEDKFVMSIEAEERFTVSKDTRFASETSPKTRSNYCAEMCACSVCSGMKEYCGGESTEHVDVFLSSSLRKTQPAVSSCAESFSTSGERGFELKFVDNPGGVSLEGDLSRYALCGSEQCEGMQISEPQILEKELDLLSSFTFPNCDLLCDLKSRSSSSNAQENSALIKHDKDYVETCGSDPICQRGFQSNERSADEKYGRSDRESHNHEHVGGEEANNEFQLYDFHEDEYEVFNLRVIHRKNRTGFEENKDFSIILNSIIACRYYVTEYLGSAAFSKVIQAHDLLTGMDVCLKIIKNDKDFFDQSLDEIKLLKFVNKQDPADEHHILRLYDYFYYQEHLFIVCELLRANLYEFQKFNEDSGGDVYFTLARIQKIARQCLEALAYLHHLGIIHCDLKPENVLIRSYSRCEIKIIDLGSSCFRSDNLCLYVQSRSYRAPEVILGLPYDEKIDIWSLGCILAELFTGDVLFPNDELVLLLARMIGMLGPIDMEMLEMGQETRKYFTDEYDLYHRNEETDQVEYIIPEKSSLTCHLEGSDPAFIEFLEYMLQMNPQRRPTAQEALQHPWLSYLYK